MAASGSQTAQSSNLGRVPRGKSKASFVNKRTHERGGSRIAEAGSARGRGGRRWWPGQQNKAFAGSAREGHGFALWRKQKVQLEYKKLLRKQKKPTGPKEDLYAERYPEHLKHLYLAEEERLKNEKRKREPEEETSQANEEHEEIRTKKNLKRKTSIQKAKEEYERVQCERQKKREQAEENRRKMEDAKKLYKRKKMEAYKVLSTRTKKGQPNFNVQMEYLLKKIQSKT